MILKTKTRWSLGLLQMMGMGRRCARVCVTWDGKRDVLPWAFVLETDVGVVNLSGWMDGWVDKWVEQDLDRVVGDADWISGA
jgi:endonuclease III